MPLADTIDPAILAYAQGLQGQQAPPTPVVAPPSRPLSSYTPEEIAAANQPEALAPVVVPGRPASTHVAPTGAVATRVANAVGAPPQGVAYQAPQAQQQAPGGPGTVAGFSPQEAFRLAGVGVPGRPAGFTPSSKSTTLEGRAASPELAEATKEKLEADANAGVAQFKYDQAAAGAQGEANKRLALQDEINARNQANRMADQQQRLSADRDHITNLMAQASAPQQSATDAYWGNKSTFAKVMTGISMFLKGFTFSGYGRGQDPGQWLNEQIAEVARDQQTRAAKTREAIGNAKDLYNMNKQALGDDDRSKLATEMALRQQLVSNLDRRVAEATAEPMQQLRLAQLRQSLADTNAKTLEDFWDKTAEKHTSSESDKYQQATQGGGDVLARLKRTRDIMGVSAEIANETPTQNVALDVEKKALENRKTAAETSKTEAEATKAQQESAANPAVTLSDAAKELKGTAYDPLRYFQGTEAQANQLSQTEYNAALEGAAVKKYGPRAGRQIVEALKANEGDLESTLKLKKQHAWRLLGSGGPAVIPGTEAGVAPDQ